MLISAELSDSKCIMTMVRNALCVGKQHGMVYDCTYEVVLFQVPAQTSQGCWNNVLRGRPSWFLLLCFLSVEEVYFLNLVLQVYWIFFSDDFFGGVIYLVVFYQAWVSFPPLALQLWLMMACKAMVVIWFDCLVWCWRVFLCSFVDIFLGWHWFYSCSLFFGRVMYS